MKLSPSMLSYSGVDNVTPTEAAQGQATASSTFHSTPSITTATSSDELVTYFVTATCAGWTAPNGMTEHTDTTFCSQSAGSGKTLSASQV